MSRRGKLEIMHEVLDFCRHGATVTDIMSRCGLSYAQIRSHVRWLWRYGFLKTESAVSQFGIEVSRFVTSGQGYALLESMDDVQAQMEKAVTRLQKDRQISLTFSIGVSLLRFRTSNVDVEVKKKPVGNDLLTPEPELKMMANGKPVTAVRVVADSHFESHGKQLTTEVHLTDPETKKSVQTSEARLILGHYRNMFLTPEGDEVEREKIHYFVLETDGSIRKNEDGSDMEVRPFEPTDILEVPEENWVPSTILGDFEVHATYELFAERLSAIESLFTEAEKRSKEDTVGMTTYSAGGFKQWYAFLVPYFEEGKFVWLMMLSDKKKKINQLTDVPTEGQVKIKEIPKLQTLPPIQALLTVPRKKK